MASPPNGVFITSPVLVLSLLTMAIFIFFLIQSLSPSCPTTSLYASNFSNEVLSAAYFDRDRYLQFSPTQEDIDWIRRQIYTNGLQMHDNILRKGINPRTRYQQLQDLNQFKGISHYDGDYSKNNTKLPCPGELLVEEHHSNYGEPWAGGRDVFEFLAKAVGITPNSIVLEVGCGSLRVGLHFIRYLDRGNFHCLERDEISLMAAFGYELPSQGLLYKRPLIVRGEDMDFSRLGAGIMYDLVYSSAVFLHIPDKLVWVGVERLAGMIKPNNGRMFVSHNIKFCSRLGGEECTKRLENIGLQYVGKRTHDSLLFNHFEIWFEFRRFRP